MDVTFSSKYSRSRRYRIQIQDSRFKIQPRETGAEAHLSPTKQICPSHWGLLLDSINSLSAGEMMQLIQQDLTASARLTFPEISIL